MTGKTINMQMREMRRFMSVLGKDMTRFKETLSFAHRRLQDLKGEIGTIKVNLACLDLGQDKEEIYLSLKLREKYDEVDNVKKEIKHYSIIQQLTKRELNMYNRMYQQLMADTLK